LGDGSSQVDRRLQEVDRGTTELKISPMRIGFLTRLVKDLEWLDLFAAALLVYWSNIQFFELINSSAGTALNWFAYAATLIVLIRGFNRIHYSHLILIAVTAVVFLVSMLLPAGEMYLFDYWYPFLLAGSMGVLMISIIRKPRYILFCWAVYSFAISIMSLQLYYAQGGGSSLYMTTSYYVLNLFVWLLLVTIERTRWYNLLPLAVIMLALVLIGTRGAIVSAAISALAAMLMLKKATFSKKQIIKYGLLVVLVLAAFALPYTEFGVKFLIFVSDLLHINSRTLRLIASSQFESESGRSEIYQIAFNAILDGNLLGYGLAGDAYFLQGGYAHNFIIELCVDFGVMALVMLGAFIWLIKKSVLAAKGIEWKKAGMLFLLVGFLPKMFSFTLLHPLTLPAIGIMMQIMRLEARRFPKAASSSKAATSEAAGMLQ
jgi:O-antigen ligase